LENLKQDVCLVEKGKQHFFEGLQQALSFNKVKFQA
jgi:hypothetical protein